MLRYLDALRVPAVASTPITPVFELRAAGLIAGSIPMNLTGNSSRRTEIAAAVAVLQATTMICAPFEISSRVISRALFRMNSTLFSP